MGCRMFKKWTVSKRHAWLRYGILIAVLAYTTWQVWTHGLGNRMFPSIHGLCPFGGVESLLAYLQSGSTLPKVFSGTMALLFTVAVTGIFFRRAFCGLICPMGTLQEAFGRLGGKVFRKRLEIPGSVDAPLRAVKYVVLLFSVALAWATGTLWFQIIDPWAAYGHLINWNDLKGTYLVGFIILVISLAGSFLVDRFFCKYLCPMGALTAIIGKFGFMRIHRRRREEAALTDEGSTSGEAKTPEASSGTCIDCGLCTRRCPMNIQVHEQDVVKQSECIDCGRCVAACPVPGALEHRFFGKRFSVAAVLILSISLYLGAILVMQAFGLDRYSGGSEATLRELAKQSGLSAVEFKKEYGLPATLSNRTGMAEIQRLIPISVVAGQNGMSTADLKKLFNLSPDLPDSTAWEPVLDTVSAEVFAASMGMDFETFRSSYGLDDTITPETPIKTVRMKLEAISTGAAATESGESCAAEGGTGCSGD
jgi:polyferredoxin